RPGLYPGGRRVKRPPLGTAVPGPISRLFRDCSSSPLVNVAGAILPAPGNTRDPNPGERVGRGMAAMGDVRVVEQEIAVNKPGQLRSGAGVVDCDVVNL